MPVLTAQHRTQKKVRAEAPPQPGQPGFDMDKALAEARHLADTLPIGALFRNPATGLLVMNTPPITSEEVYARFY
jgi:hypothetical protein